MQKSEMQYLISLMDAQKKQIDRYVQNESTARNEIQELS